VLALAYADTPVTPVGGVLLPLAFDSLLVACLSVGGFVDLMPVGGYRSLDVFFAQPNPVAGVTFYAAHVILDFSLQSPGVSPAVPFVLP
jgi:hypothetical protein